MFYFYFVCLVYNRGLFCLDFVGEDVLNFVEIRGYIEEGCLGRGKEVF